jgi:peptide/nickel transport system permease protein
MLRILAYRAVVAVVTLLGVSVIVFAATEALPGDVANAVLGRDATPDQVALIEQRLGLNQPLPERYGRWLLDLLRGDAGESLAASVTVGGVQATTPSVQTAAQPTAPPQGVPVTELIGYRLKNTAILALTTSLLLIPFSLILGLIAASRAQRVTDHFIGTVTLVLGSIPEFVLGTVLVLLFAVTWHVFPATSLIDQSRPYADQLEYLVLPVLALLASMLGQTTRMVRAGVLGVLNADYVQQARLAGLPARRVLRRYVLRNALGATIQVYAISVAWMFGGIVVVEAVFQYPGLGAGLVDAVSARDLPVVQAIALIIAAGYILINLVADALTVVVTPKLRVTA